MRTSNTTLKWPKNRSTFHQCRGVARKLQFSKWERLKRERMMLTSRFLCSDKRRTQTNHRNTSTATRRRHHDNDDVDITTQWLQLKLRLHCTTTMLAVISVFHVFKSVTKTIATLLVRFFLQMIYEVWGSFFQSSTFLRFINVIVNDGVRK